MLAASAIDALERLVIPQGRLAGETLSLAPFQKQFVEGALAERVTVGCLSVGRGNAKTALAAGLAVTHLLGEWDDQPQREIPLAARTREQGTVAFNFARSFLDARPDLADRITVRKSPLLEIELDAPDGPHRLKVVPSTGKAVLGGGATLAILDERAAWMEDRGNELESAILTSLGKRDGRALIISTSAPTDTNPFSIWLDQPPTGCYVQEHRPPPGLPADDLESLLIANPGAVAGIGASVDWLQAEAQKAIQRGGSALAYFRNLHRNERVHTDTRSVVVTVDEWLGVETDTLPPRDGPVVIGLDLGGSASMTAAAFFWPACGRLEVMGWFPSEPGLLARGQADSVGTRYCDMAERGELHVIGAQTVPVAAWIGEVLRHAEGEAVAAIVADRFKQAEVGEALDANCNRAHVVWRGMGWRDGSEDVERFRRAVHDRVLKVVPSLLMRSALSDAVTMLDPAGNAKLVKGRSTGRIDAAAAAILAIAEGMRLRTRPVKAARTPVWA